MIKGFSKRKLLKNAKGGGTSNVQSIPDWAIPYIKNVGNAAEQRYNAGQLGLVADNNPLLKAAMGSGANAIADTTNAGIAGSMAQQDRLTGHAMSGGYDTQALKDAAILQAGMQTADLGRQYGAMGTLGSARQNVLQGAQNAATAAQFAKIDYDAAQQNFQNKMTAEGALGQSFGAGQNLAMNAAKSFSSLGEQGRDMQSQVVNQPWSELERYASTIYGNPARQTAVAKGGK